MAYNETLAERIREVLREHSDATERKMFGGIAFMVRGHRCCGIVGDDLMLRIGEAGYENALKRPHVRPMDFTGRPMKGMIYVDPVGSKTPNSLKSWLEMAVAFVESLPDKKAKANVGRARKKLATHKAR